MAVNYILLGKRISYFRTKNKLSQEELAAQLNLSREYINKIETGKRTPSLDVLIDLANLLHVSADDFLVDSLEYSASTANSAIHQLLLDCNELEESVIVKTVENLKSILYSLGI